MGRKERVQRTAEEKWEIVQEGIKSGNVSETCRRYVIAPNLFYRWKDEAEQGAKAALGGRSAAAADTASLPRFSHETSAPICSSWSACSAFAWRGCRWMATCRKTRSRFPAPAMACHQLAGPAWSFCPGMSCTDSSSLDVEFLVVGQAHVARLVLGEHLRLAPRAGLRARGPANERNAQLILRVRKTS